MAINGSSQQDAFTDRELVGFAVTSTTPACNSIISTQPMDFIINLSDAVDTSTVQATDFTVNGTSSDCRLPSANGNATITFHYYSSPVTGVGSNHGYSRRRIYSRFGWHAELRVQCTFCYAVTPLKVTTTVPPDGGTFSPAAPGDYQYDVNFNQPVDAASVDTSDLTLTGKLAAA